LQLDRRLPCSSGGIGTATCPVATGKASSPGMCIIDPSWQRYCELFELFTKT
jgi:hypothetical protein